jgi:hypothetical protein
MSLYRYTSNWLYRSTRPKRPLSRSYQIRATVGRLAAAALTKLAIAFDTVAAGGARQAVASVCGHARVHRAALIAVGKDLVAVASRAVTTGRTDCAVALERRFIATTDVVAVARA